jgi:hypothetical protein
MGQALADAVGFKEPPMEIDDSARQVLEQVCIMVVSGDYPTSCPGLPGESNREC